MKAQDQAAAKFENFDIHEADAATRTRVRRKLLHLKRVKVTQRAHEGTQDAGSHCTRRANSFALPALTLLNLHWLQASSKCEAVANHETQVDKCAATDNASQRQTGDSARTCPDSVEGAEQDARRRFCARRSRSAAQ